MDASDSVVSSTSSTPPVDTPDITPQGDSPSASTHPPKGRGSFDFYSEITRQITQMLEKGVVPWRSPILGRASGGGGGGGYPKNLNTGKPYRGVNVFLLALTAYMKGFGSSYWLTYRQAKERGGNVRKNEKASMVVFWKPHEVKDQETGEPKQIFILRYYHLFNAEQCEGIDIPDAVSFTPTPFNPIESAQAIVTGYHDGPTIEHGGTQAFYRLHNDLVRIPEPTRFTSSEEYFSTLYHELSHSTAHGKRLNRPMATSPKPFGTPDYGKEELIAEMSAAFLCGEAGIQPAVIANQAAYLSGWLGQIKADRKLIVWAAGAGQRAADWIRGRRDHHPSPAESSES